MRRASPNKARQGQALSNHSPAILVVEEIQSEAELDLLRVAQSRGVRVLAGLAGSLVGLLGEKGERPGFVSKLLGVRWSERGQRKGWVVNEEVPPALACVAELDVAAAAGGGGSAASSGSGREPNAAPRIKVLRDLPQQLDEWLRTGKTDVEWRWRGPQGEVMVAKGAL